jgi:hypothetical protein
MKYGFVEKLTVATTVVAIALTAEIPQMTYFTDFTKQIAASASMSTA